ncbi:hypothetical protein Taro_014205 [Colocasia esculenta]|uniref:Uncharacterized protein n=1 Tax=Colocasia esculenta TaxID=4460 RepID=A0A843UPG4_COLES|nr:hypothetical protein [Colocasia esculenta]
MEGRGSFGETQASRISAVNGERKSRSSSPKGLPSAFRIIASMRRSRSATRQRRLTNSWSECTEPSRLDAWALESTSERVWA